MPVMPFCDVVARVGALLFRVSCPIGVKVGVVLALVRIIILFDVAGLPRIPVSAMVIITLMESPSFGVNVKLGALVPAANPLTFH